MPEILVPPDPIYLDGPGTLRWASGSPDGPRSLTWSVIGAKDGSVYVGVRSIMRDMKLSLHPAKWRMAFTKQAAPNYLGPEQDRVTTRWAIPPETAPGWRLAAVIFMPSDTFADAVAEPRIRSGQRVLWFPAPDPPEHLRFYVLLGDADSDALAVENIIGDVGRMTLATGLRVWVVADVVTMTDEMRRGVDDIRGKMAHAADPSSFGWAWGEVDGAPNLLDVAAVLPRN